MSADAKPNRQAQRRARTRRRLIDAARAVFAEQGIEATRINEITDAADVGFGSFYNHFESKEAIVTAVIEELVRAIGEDIDAATATLDDPAEVVSAAHRSLIQRAIGDPEFGRLLVGLEVSHDLASTTLGGYALRDLTLGIETGRFAVEDPGVALAAAGGALLGVVRAALRGHDGPEVPIAHAAGVLRLLGLGAEEAAAIAERPMPETLSPRSSRTEAG